MNNSEYILFSEALNVVNQSLKKNYEVFPYNVAIEAMQKVASGTKVGVEVYAEDTDSPTDFFTIAYKDHHIELVAHGKENPAFSYKVSRQFLRDIVENPQRYINNPEKLDIDWLRSRIGF